MIDDSAKNLLNLIVLIVGLILLYQWSSAG